MTGSIENHLRYDKAPSRRARIRQEVRVSGFCSVLDLATQLGVSDMTIRRDLRRLQRDGEVRMVRGGASLAHATLRTSEFTTRARLNAAAKDRIGIAATEDLGPTEVIAIDAGTTAFDAVTHLPADFHGHVVTHSVPVMQHLLQLTSVRVIGLGGQLYGPSQAFAGPVAAEQARRLRIDRFLLGAASVDRHGGYGESDVEQEVKAALMDAASSVVLLVDATKFTPSAPVRLCGLDTVDRVITDAEPPADFAQAAAANAVSITVVTES